jgi:hypothetical protein
MRCGDFFRLLSEIRALPEISIRMSGDDTCKKLFHYFTQSHPRYRFIQNKRWGVALLPVSDTYNEYLKGKDKQALRSNRKRALDLGFRFCRSNPLEHLHDILSINASTPVRQGRPMDSSYLSVRQLRAFFDDKAEIYGVFDSTGILKAYADTPIAGEICIFSRLLGHSADLDKGIMYLLVSGVVQEMTEHKTKHGVPLWVMYDTFFGASQGLRYFKERLGFRPYKVRWIWEL